MSNPRKFIRCQTYLIRPSGIKYRPSFTWFGGRPFGWTMEWPRSRTGWPFTQGKAIWLARLCFPHLMRLASRNQRSTCNTSLQSRTPLSLNTAGNTEASRIAARSSTRVEKNEGMLIIWFLCCCGYPIWQANAQIALDQANLLSGVRNDIECVSSSSSPFICHSFCFISAYKSSAADSLLAERGRIDSSHRMTDDMLQ